MAAFGEKYRSLVRKEEEELIPVFESARRETAYGGDKSRPLAWKGERTSSAAAPAPTGHKAPAGEAKEMKPSRTLAA